VKKYKACQGLQWLKVDWNLKTRKIFIPQGNISCWGIWVTKI